MSNKSQSTIDKISYPSKFFPYTKNLRNVKGWIEDCSVALRRWRTVMDHAKDLLRNFDLTSWTLTFRGDKYEIKTDNREYLYTLYPKVSAEANKLWWE